MKSYILTLCLLAVAACTREEPVDKHGHGHEVGEAEFERGPHNGRLLEHENFAVEVTIFESGVLPEFRVYLYENGKALPASSASVTLKVTRLDGEVNEYTFTPQTDFLRGNDVVREPHSFDVELSAQRTGKDSVQWAYASYEGRTTIADATARSMGIEALPAGPATLREQIVLSGTVQADPTRVSEVRARYAGVIREVLVQPSSKVQKGSTLAQIQSNESLQNYPLIAPISGTLVEHRAQVGEATGDAALFTIMDTSRVWVELDVFQKDLPLIKAGQRVELLDLDENSVATGTIARIGTVATHGSQSVQARVVIDNASGALRPGQFVTAHVNVAEHKVALAVEREAIQKFRDFDVVFEKVNDTYEVRMLALGRSDATHVEITDGLKPGALYVARNSYLIKADIEKSGASHDH
jgi:cobalt-zinc-cadmium efflux system membrane fusion protein